MTPDLSHFRTLLLSRRDELRSRITSVADQLDDPADADWDDRAIEMEDDEALEGLGRASLRELQAIDAALRRLDAGTYGTCASCGEPISPRRLASVPYATRCQSCMG